MSAVLVDTDVLIEVLRGRDRALLLRWTALGSGTDAVLYSPVTVAELWHGMRPAEEAVVLQLLDAMIPLPIDAQIGRRAGEYLRRFHKSHGVETSDALIAATAAVHGCSLRTRNRKQYPMRDVELY
ncbi:MAG: type II toxin-antitoxin system VapC family toxin [Bryobacteraceae bacterium]|jgi:predicted nucleic acid-binding protein